MGLFDKLFGKKEQPPASVPPPASKPATAAQDDAWQDQGVPQEVQPREVQAMLEAPNPPALLDVREEHERKADGWIPDSIHIPMTEIRERHGEVDRSRPVVVYCAGGMRSFDAGFFLIEQGCKGVSNLNGGFKAWNGPKERA